MAGLEQAILDQTAQRLVKQISDRCHDGTLGSASCTVAVYDTAWVSMISKGGQWLFPESFRYVLNTQLPDGGWQTGSPCDDILTTLASLKAMLCHFGTSVANPPSEASDLSERISKAKQYLQDRLQGWDVNASMSISFEFLVPGLLSMLETENIHFNFPGRKALERIKAIKLQNFDEEQFYLSPGGYLHSLEGLVGWIDFDRLSHHKSHGSMMAAPASTAAYLIHSSSWDDQAEQYIRIALTGGTGDGSGGVPTVFPTAIFEPTWVSLMDL
ncbi:MAG: hypothetical protein Q9201_000055 [Fulgogasparrea decipioides]